MGLFAQDGKTRLKTPMPEAPKYQDEQEGGNFWEGVRQFGSDVNQGLTDFFGSFKDDPDKRETYATVGSLLDDLGKSNRLGKLQEVEAATAPFVRGSITKDFTKGAGGFDAIAQMEEAFAMREKRKERDRRESALNEFFGQDKADVVRGLSDLSASFDKYKARK